MQRVDPKQVEAMVAASAEPAEARIARRNAVPSTPTPRCWPSRWPKPISFDEFAKVDLRVVRVIEAEDVPGRKSC